MSRLKLNLCSVAFLFFLCHIPHLSAQQSHQAELSVAAAADLQFAMQDIATRFQKESGIAIKPIYGSSGNFFEQIQNGAPFDLFFSANLDYPQKLQSAGLTLPDSYFPYAQGKIVLWVPNASKVNLSTGLKALVDSSIKKIAIANPEHAPYGQAAVAALKKENLYDQMKSKLVLGENISQAATFVASGAADAAIVARSLARSPYLKDKGRYTEIPDADYPPIAQACVILKSSSHQPAARQFLAFLKTSAVTSVLRSYGFEVSAAPDR